MWALFWGGGRPLAVLCDLMEDSVSYLDLDSYLDQILLMSSGETHLTQTLSTGRATNAPGQDVNKTIQSEPFEIRWKAEG